MTDADRPRAAGLRASSARLAMVAVAGEGGHRDTTGGRRHRLACRGCGAVTEVDCAGGRCPCLAPAAGAGFTVEEAEVTFWGLCPRCRPGC